MEVRNELGNMTVIGIPDLGPFGPIRDIPGMDKHLSLCGIPSKYTDSIKVRNGLRFFAWVIYQIC